MAERVPARLTAAAGRKFGFTVGGAFMFLALLLHFWRHATVVPRVFGIIAALLLAGALLIPAHLGPVERAWMKLGLLISKVTTPIFMGIVYFVVITPTGVVRRLLGKNALVRGANTENMAPGGYWIARQPGKTRGDMSRQF